MKRTECWSARGAAVAVLTLCALTVSALPARAESRPNDDSVRDWVKTAILEDTRVPSASITVTVDDGIVTLSGSVDNLAASKYADLETRKIKGVRGVINELRVDAPDRYDFDISQDILRRLLADSSIETPRIRVDVADGHVTLRGQVANWAEASEAELIATEVRGVEQVTNELIPQFPAARSDAEIQKDVAAALERDTYLTGLPITVSVDGGKVRLEGEVGTAYQKNRAGTDAHWIWNVTDVDNQLNVVWWESAGARKKASVPTDAQLKQSVRDELYQDLRIAKPGAIDVEARAGAVTLRGWVPTLREKRIAEQDIHDVVGVAWVTSLIEVQGTPRSDEAVRHDVEFAIDTDYTLDPDFVDVKVKGGTVTLTGDATTIWEKMHATDVASAIHGVRRVVNELRVSLPSDLSDASIRTRVKERLARNAETTWVADHIQVSVMEGKVTLRGEVNYWSEYITAENVAYRTRGVWEVVNHLEVRDFDNYLWEDYAHPWPHVYAYDLIAPDYDLHTP